MPVIGLTGMPAAGKSNTVKILKGFWDIHSFRISHIITEELRLRQLPLTGKNYETLAAELRSQYGDSYFAEKMYKRIQSEQNENVLCIDGIRTIAEVEVLRGIRDFFLVALWAPYKIRLDRALRPGPHVISISSENDFKKRDETNINLGVGNVVTMSDILISNDVDGINTLTVKIINLLGPIIHNDVINLG